MRVGRKEKINELRGFLFDKLKDEKAFWSYVPESVVLSKIDDDNIIALTMRHLDLPEIDQLFTVFSTHKIKEAWKKLLVPEGEYLYTLNRFFAWYYFNAKHPDSYLKSLQTRHLNRIIHQLQ
ncbi:MAG: hypothetical protein K2K84_01970 [Muribaculaceae bacterium]|nr:hypothetical protein [Muribaculaceae bacterium]